MISATSTAAQDVQASTSSFVKLAENFDTFLTLLTTQLKYQDPLEPMKSSEFVNQLVQFSGVEQAIGTNKNLEKLIAGQAQNQTAAAINFIGKTVEVRGDTAPLQNGGAEFTYELEQKAEGTLLIVTDEAGKVMFSTAGNTEPGKHSFSWDGLDKNGDQVPDGAYTLTVGAKDADGGPVNVTTHVIANITGLESTDDGLALLANGVKLLFNNVISVRTTEPVA